MVLLINFDINRYIPTKYVKHNICYFKYVFKLLLGHSPPQWSFLSPKSLTLLWGREFDHWDPQNMLIFNIFPNSKLKRFAFYIYIYDRNSNLNSHTRIFWRSRGSNPHPHRGVRFFGNGDYHLTEYPSGFYKLTLK